jgi:hypothetical protein
VSRADAIARLESLLARVASRKDAPRPPARPAPSPSATVAVSAAVTPAPAAPVAEHAPEPVRTPEPLRVPLPETKPALAPPSSAVASFLVDDSVMRAPTRQVTPRDHSESVGRPPPPRAPTPIPRLAPAEFKPTTSSPVERSPSPAPTLPPHEKPPPSGSIRALAASVVMPPSAETGFDLDTPTDVQFDASRRSPERRVVPPPPAAATSPLLAPPTAPTAAQVQAPALKVEPEVKAEPVPLVAERFQPPPVTVTRDAVKVVQPPAPRPTTLRGMLQRSLGLRAKS